MKLTDTFLAIRYFGFFTLTKAVWYRVQRKTNFFRRKFPTTKWDQLQLPDFVKAETDLNDIKKLLRQSNFLPLTKQDDYLNKIFPVSNITESADEILDNNFTYFSKTKVQMGQNIDWHLNPFNSAQWPADIHWCSLSNFSPNHGDVKIVWEPSRFSWAYCLVRAYLATGQEKYAEKFWNLFESWLKANQPNLGINWGCGQECALRLMAWCFALFSLLDAPSTTEDRINKMLRALAVTADRIEKNISDAIRQKTNHAMTEAMGLYTVGTLFPFLIKADNWKKRGKQILEQQGLKQIYEDGSYLQQSMNYHRLMLQTYLWCLRIGQLNGDGFSQNLKDRLEKATEFLYQMQDDSTGRVPNYGANDGALILPLNTCEYLDYRPVIQSCQYLLKQEKLYDVGPWDEDLLWLFGPDAAKKTTTIKQRTSSQFPIGGYYTLRSPKTWAMIRCHSYRDRVGHVDLLSMDFWADGLNLLCDCGSYKYFAPNEAQLQKYFKSIWAHNTIIVDDSSPLRLFSRFIYLPWPKAK
ncbi:MAG: heparinase II/III family protein, partial [Planctomycetota bacterium]